VRAGLALVAAIAAAALASACGGSQDEQRPAPSLSGELTERLRGGGHIVVFRHAGTDSSVDMTEDLDDCSRQRNLDAAGRAESRAIGAAFERFRIPVGQVLASPFCRTRDTARLAFGRVRETRRLLAEEFFASPAQAHRRGLPRLLRERPRRGTNTVLVTHGSAIEAATGENPDEGGAVIVAPRRRAPGFEVVEAVPVEAWSDG
jgi:phosphohistidine phosphatase SixA